MTLLTDRRADSLFDEEALIREARRLRRRRWMNGAVVLGLALVAGTIYAVSSPPRRDKPHNQSNVTPQPYFAGTAAEKRDIARDSPDLLQPSAIAVAQNGDLLIADSGRNRILERTPKGQLKVFAGTGAVGLAANGGRALDAKFDGIAAAALSRAGTLYVAEGGYSKSSPCQLDAITAGHIRTLSTACVGELVIGPHDVLYGAVGNGIYRISANGHLDLLLGGPKRRYPYYGRLTPLQPSTFAFAGNGDLLLYSEGRFEVDRLAPDGAFSEVEPLVGAGYAPVNMVTLQDGSVLLSTSGGTFQRITPTGVDSDYFEVPPNRVAGYDGASGDWWLYGMAIAPNDTMFTVGENEAGYNSNNAINATILFRISPKGRASVLPITTPLRATLPQPGATDFPTSTYPSQVPSADGRLSSCPNPAGLEPFDPAARANIAATFATLSRGSFFADLQVADRSWWPGLFAMRQDPEMWLDGQASINSIAAASTDALAPIIAKACGQRLIDESLVVTFTPSATRPDSHFFVLDRGGRPLVYLQEY